jgi:hypothetical protein
VTFSSRPVLVAGIPRSGTTWTAQVLAHAHGSALLHEPDNEKEHLAALRAKRSLGRFPVLRPGESAPAYEGLWRHAFSGVTEPRSGRAIVATQLWLRASREQREAAVSGRLPLGLRVARALTKPPAPPGSDAGTGDLVVKSVHAPLAVEWMAHCFPAVQVVVVIRHPASVLSSWRELGLADQDRALDRHPAVREGLMRAWELSPPDDDALSRAAWHVCLLTAALLDSVARHPEWSLVEHDDLCRRPVERFADLSRRLGMTWNERGEQFLLASDTAGEGFAVRRRAGEQPGRWRVRLSADDVDVLAGTMRRFPLLDRWSADLGTPATGPGHG